ncbi:MAG: glycosyltransferase family 4 protein [Bryobacteraceae bacterium]
MKTLHIDTGREMRGGQWQALYLVERLEDAKLLTPLGSRLLDEARRHGLDVWPLSYIMMARVARSSAVVHAHDAHAHSLAAFFGGAPLVVSRRVAFPVKRDFASKWKYAKPARFIAVSKFAAGRLGEAGIPREKIRVVYDGVPVPENPSTRQPGRVVALASKSVDIPGIEVQSISDLWQDLSAASVFVYASEMEGLGSAALAAMACGVPVVASRAGGLPEIVEHERTGLLVDGGDFRGAVQRLLENPAEAAAMGDRGREMVRQNFSVGAMVNATRKVYEEVLG